jgi:hypothetical protein
MVRMKQLHTEVTIDATPEDVWAVLMDFERYPEWNPFLVEMAGVAAEGQHLRVRFQPPGGRAVTMAPTVTEVRDGEVFEWLGHLGVPGVFDGRHRFELHPADHATRLTQGETFTGALVPLFARTLERKTAAGFAAMNDALKARVEQLCAARLLA